MSGFSTHLAQKVANHFYRNIPQPATAATYLALFIADPTDNNITANEVSADWYARQLVPTWAAPQANADSVFISNNNEVRYAAVTGNAVQISHYGIYDAATAGNLLDSGALLNKDGVVTPRVLNEDDVFVVKAGECILRFK